MAGKRDYYDVLGVTQTASHQEIARAYRKLAIQFHPDSNPGDETAVLQFKEAAEAYEVLSDAQKRARYDQFGHAGVDGPGQAGFDNVEDIFDAFGDIFGSMFGGGGSRRRGGRRVHRGADLQCHTEVTLEEAARGVTRSLQFYRHHPCDTCSGSGSRPGASPQTCQRCGGQGRVIQSAGILRVQTSCPTCQGRGTVISDPCGDCHGERFQKKSVTLDIRIPAGIDDGMQVRLSGEGEPSPDGGPAGDCYCRVSVTPHDLFEREGDELFLQMPITFTQAALGAELEIPKLDGRDELTVPAGSQSGDIFRLRGHGMPNPRNGQRGDLLVQIHVEVPRSLAPDQEKLLRQLAEMEHADVSPHRKSFLDKIKDYFVHHDEVDQRTHAGE